jgi:hypothetical protein
MIAGTMSSISLTSSPTRCSLPWQHGQMSLSGSMTTFSRQMIWQAADVTRGLRARGFRPVRFSVRHRIPFGSTGRDDRSPSPSASCPSSASRFSERAPYSARFSVSSIARSFSFSARNPAIISIRMSGSRGNEETPGDMHRFYRTDSGCRQVRKCGIRIISMPSPWYVCRSGSSPCR